MNTIDTGIKELTLSALSLQIGKDILDRLSYKRNEYMRLADNWLELAHEAYPDGSIDFHECYQLDENKEYLMRVTACDNIAAHIMKFFN
jgi:hypothetical protein